jgi:hypothetical protein
MVLGKYTLVLTLLELAKVGNRSTKRQFGTATNARKRPEEGAVIIAGCFPHSTIFIFRH